MKRLEGCLLALIAAAFATPLHADPLFDKYFAKADGGTPCYARSYDRQHLRQHSRQKVRQITLAFDLTKAGSDKPADASRFEVTLGLMIKDKTEAFTSPAFCSAERGSFLCYVEGDGGKFRAKPGPADGLTIEIVGDGLRMEGESGFVEVGGKRSDDNLFTLRRVHREQCRSR
jgi:hypothetical protein